MSIIRLRNISVSFGGPAILEKISLSIDAGERVCLLGRNGMGKSTLMNVIGCLDKPTSGSYVLDGRDVSRLNDNQLADIRGRKKVFTVGIALYTISSLLSALAPSIRIPASGHPAPSSATRAEPRAPSAAAST